ncbi:MAG: glycosyltransferase, partial [Deltaproteobacteria bacterium]|nr:glycosyltransferase [Deltaproteobacteria bacterium]
MSSQQKPRSVIVIPFYNHSTSLLDVVSGALEVNDSVMVVDDGSTDKGADTLAELSVHFIHHEKNLGKGAAIKTAAKEA